MKTRILLSILSFPFILACGGKSDDQNQPKPESVLAGKLTVQCDNAIMKMMNLIKPKYDSSFPDAHVNFEPMNAREAMKALFAGTARCVVVARDYLRDEDSIMKAVGINPHLRYKFAHDALVFFVNKNFPIDTISDQTLKKLLSNNNVKLNELMPHAKYEGAFATLNENSSVYGNLCLHFSKDNSIPRQLDFCKDYDELKSKVLNNPIIGIGYLSQLENESELKMLKISWTDSTGRYWAPKTVHQSYLTMGQYPYKTTIYAYLYEQERKLPMGFASYYATDATAQRLFLYSGIEPAYAKIVIKTPE